jgi:hypothetical protein
MKFVFIAKQHLAGGMAVQYDGLVLRLSCLAESINQSEIPERRDSRPADEGRKPLDFNRLFGRP